MRKLSKAAMDALRRVHETGMLTGKSVLTAMLRDEGYVEYSGIVQNHFRLCQLTVKGHNALGT